MNFVDKTYSNILNMRMSLEGKRVPSPQQSNLLLGRVG